MWRQRRKKAGAGTPGGGTTQIRQPETGAARARAFPRIREVVRTSLAVKCLLTLLFIGFVSLFTALLFARVVGCRPVMWFPDTLNVLAVFGSFILLVGLIWDGLLVALGSAPLFREGNSTHVGGGGHLPGAGLHAALSDGGIQLSSPGARLRWRSAQSLWACAYRAPTIPRFASWRPRDFR